MDPLLIVNADDFGLSKAQNYGIIDACRNGVVTSTTALVNGEAIGHAVALSRELPTLGVGMHFVLTLGVPLTPMVGLTRDGVLGKWGLALAEQGMLPLDSIAHELESQFNRFVALFGRKPTHIDSHHHIHMSPGLFPLVADFARDRDIPLRIDRDVLAQQALSAPGVRSTDAFSSAFYGDNISQDLFLHVLDSAARQGAGSLEVMCHPAFVDNTLLKSGYCYQRLMELDVLTSVPLKAAIEARGYRLGTFQSL